MRMLIGGYEIGGGPNLRKQPNVLGVLIRWGSAQQEFGGEKDNVMLVAAAEQSRHVLYRKVCMTKTASCIMQRVEVVCVISASLVKILRSCFWLMANSWSFHTHSISRLLSNTCVNNLKHPATVICARIRFSINVSKKFLKWQVQKFFLQTVK